MREDDYLFDPAATPTPEIARLEALLKPLRHAPPAFPDASETRPVAAIVPAERRHRRTRYYAAAAALMLVAVYGVARSLVDPWAVTGMRGTVALGSTRVDGTSQAARLRPGQSIETAAGSSARVNVGRIGRADIGPKSLVRLIRAEGTEHRLALERGTIHARIWAPPRFFLVETASALAVDLGCVYSLTVDRRGAGWLQVESGEVELVEGTRRSLVLAGNAARLRPGVGPGMPFPVRASAAFRAALDAYEGTPSAASLQTLLAATDRSTTITLWHLLQRVDPAARGTVLDRLLTFVPLPEDVHRADILTLDEGALDSWKHELDSSWSTETIPTWKRWWRRAWSAMLRA